MITRTLIAVAIGATLSACQPALPDSGRGVGFDGTFEQQMQQRERDAALTSSSVPAPASVTSAPLSSLNDGSPEATAAETARVLAATRTGGASNGLGNDAFSNSGVEPINASPSNAAPATVGISNENDFDAVAGRRSIDDDAARIASNRANYQVVQPQALPDRSDAEPNIVAYALQNSHARGTEIYPRRGFNKANKFARACAEFSHPDQAQIAFLNAGGPTRDRNGMDPDGDGFACDWDPSPFRRAAQGG